MINYFLQQQPNLTHQTKKLILDSVSHPRKYQPFHIECATTHKKICYCVNNPVMNVNIDPKGKQQMWQKYEQAEDFYVGVNKREKQKAEEHFERIKSKIQCLSKKEVVDFVKSIKKQKNLMGEIIQY